jgi:uncharacterized protein HemX
MARDPYEVQLERVRDWAAGFWNRSEEDTEALRAVIRELDKLREENSALGSDLNRALEGR